MSNSTHARAQELKQYLGYVHYLWRRDISWWRRTQRTGRLALCNIHTLQSQGHKLLNTANGCQLWEKGKEVRPLVDAKSDRISSKAESTYWTFFTSQVFRLTPHVPVVNPQRACAARVTVLGLCVCVCGRVCVSVTQHLTFHVFIRATNDTNLLGGR